MMEFWRACGLLKAYWLPKTTMAKRNKVKNLMPPCRYGFGLFGYDF